MWLTKEANTLPEDMKALYDRFKREVPEVTKLEQETDQTYEKLREQLEKPERKLLLKLTNASRRMRHYTASLKDTAWPGGFSAS